MSTITRLLGKCLDTNTIQVVHINHDKNFFAKLSHEEKATLSWNPEPVLDIFSEAICGVMFEEILVETLLKTDPAFYLLKLAKIFMLLDFIDTSLEVAAIVHVGAGYVREGGDDGFCQEACVLANWSQTHRAWLVRNVYLVKTSTADDVTRRTAGNGHHDGYQVTDGAGQVFCLFRHGVGSAGWLFFW